MLRTFELAWYIVVLGIVVMIGGDLWYVSASGDYTSAESVYIASSDNYNHDAIVGALWDMHNAQGDMLLASLIFDLGFLGVAIGVGLIAYGLHERDRPQPMPTPSYYPSPYPMPAPPPGYQYPPQYPQTPPGQQRP